MDSNKRVSRPGRLKRWCKVIWNFLTPCKYAGRRDSGRGEIYENEDCSELYQYPHQEQFNSNNENEVNSREITFVVECTSKTEDNKETAVGGIENVFQVEEEGKEPSKIVYTRSYLLQFERMAICQTVPDALANFSILKKLSPNSALGTFVVECTSKTEDNKETAVGGIENVFQVEEEGKEPSKIVYTRSYLLQFERMAICQTVPDALANFSILKKLSPNSALGETVAAFNCNNLNRRPHNRIHRNTYNNAGQNFQTETAVASYRGNTDRRPHNPKYRNGHNRAGQNFQTETMVASCRGNANRRPHNPKYRNGYNRAGQNFQTPGHSLRSDTERESAKKTIHMQLSLNSETKLETTKNAWVPAIAARIAQTATDGISVTAVSNIEWNTTEELNKKVRSILNKITPENFDDMIRSFVELPINTFERLENAAVMVFEKAIREQNFAFVYAKLCSVDMYVTVVDKETISFKSLIIKKCKSLFESSKSRTMDSLNKLQDIDLCKDPEKKKQLQCEHEDEERRSRKRSVANCCFIGELFKEGIIDSKLIENYIAYLVDQRSDEPTECLCNLLRTSGSEIEQRCDLNDTFVKLEYFMSIKCMSSRIRFMVQDIVELNRKKLSIK